MLKLTIVRDEHAENPLNDTEWKLYSFSRNHTNFKHPDNFIQSRDRYGAINWQVGFKRKAQYSLARLLSCYQHSGTTWSFKGEGTQCKFDTAQIAGVLVWEGKAADCGSAPELREAYARSMIEVHNEWLAGNVYGYTLVDEDNDIDEACWGFYGDGQDLADVIAWHLSAGMADKEFELEVEWEGLLTKEELKKAWAEVAVNDAKLEEAKS